MEVVRNVILTFTQTATKKFVWMQAAIDKFKLQQRDQVYAKTAQIILILTQTLSIISASPMIAILRLR